MDNNVSGASNSDCEFVSENEVVSKAKGKKKQSPKKTNQKKNAKPPRAPATDVSDTTSKRMMKKRSIWWDHYQETDTVDMAECIYCHKKIERLNT